MAKTWLLSVLACTMAAAAAYAGQGEVAEALDLPKPEVFAQAEDRERARLLTTACTEEDVGRGCYRQDGRAHREFPCTRRTGAAIVEWLPTDQCYRMEAPRRYKGIWVDAFEGQHFIPDGATAPQWPRTGSETPGWREQFERARAATIWIDVSRVNLKHAYRAGGRKVRIEFIGRKTMDPGHHGHLGMSGQAIIVDRLIASEEVD